MPTKTKNLDHVYAPRGSCKDFFYERFSEVLLSGPAGTGKSRACLEKLFLLAAAFPGMRGLIVRKTLASLANTALVTWKRDVIKEALETGEVQYYGGSAAEAPQYRFRNGSIITIGGLDKASRVMSSEYDIIYVQEATELTEDDWESLTTRLRNNVLPFQQLFADTNPSTPTHWLKLRADSGKVRMLESRHEDNPVYFDEDGSLTPLGTAYLSKLDNLSGVRKQRLRYGKWVAAEGIIYEDYESTVHLVDKLPAMSYYYWSVDFGYTNPFVFQQWGVDNDGVLYLVKELYRTGRLVDEMATEINKLHLPRPRELICDHDAEGRATLERALGIKTKAAHKKVLAGIDKVAKRFKDRRIFLYRGAQEYRDPNLESAKKPTSTIEELPGYIWKDRVGKEEPVKEDDHGCDAMRYVVAQMDLRGRPNIRWLH